MNYRYLIISLCLSCIVIIQHGFANDEDIYGECKSLTTQGYTEYTTIYPQELISVAKNNLKQYCCKYKKPYLTVKQSEQCKEKISDYYVDSPRLYDHLIDLGMRYLDGDSNLQYSQAPLDAKGKERREWVTEYGNTPTGRIALELTNKYTEYRGTMIEDFDILNSGKDCEIRTDAFEEYNKNRDTLSLAKKYFVLCELNSCMAGGSATDR